MRARHPDREGLAQTDVAIRYDVYDGPEPTLVLVPTWCIFHSRFWKMQIPYLSRFYRIVTYDPRGNGRSGRPVGKEHYSWRHHVGDLLAVLDATDTEQAFLLGVSVSGYWSNVTSVLHPERVHGVIAIGPGAGLGILPAEHGSYSYTDELDTTEGWAKENVHYIRRAYEDYVEFFVSRLFNEPHSTKAIEDGISWAMETDAETLIASDLADVLVADDMAAFYRRTTNPLLIIHGTEDEICALESSRELARLTGGILVEFEGSGHAPNVRDPVRVNHLIKEFVDRVGYRRKVTA